MEDLQMPLWYSSLSWEWLWSFAVYNYSKAWPMQRLTSLGDLKAWVQGRDWSLLYCTVVTEPGAERDWLCIPLLRCGKREVPEEHEFWVIFDLYRTSFILFFSLWLPYFNKSLWCIYLQRINHQGPHIPFLLVWELSQSSLRTQSQPYRSLCTSSLSTPLDNDLGKKKWILFTDPRILELGKCHLSHIWYI